MVSSMFCAGLSFAEPEQRVWLETTHGPILLALATEDAPITTENFLDYVETGFYDGLVFHRVVRDFVIQSGGFDRNLVFRPPTSGTIKGEANNGLLNAPYRIAMGLVGGDPDSAQSQFYINTANNDFLDGDYTVFGEVVAGQATVDRINGLIRDPNDRPFELPRILHARKTEGFPVMALHTGSWYDEQTSGTGFNLEITNDASTESGPLAVVYWYDFDQGEQIWLTGVQSFEWGDHQITIDLIGTDSPVADANFRVPPNNEAFEKWGTLTIEFRGCAQGTFGYESPTKGQGQVDVVRLTLPANTTCESL